MARREGTHMPAVRAASERNLGITQRCTPILFAWTGDIRKRYTDFLVYEIRKDGTVVHLYDYEVDEEQEKLVRQFAQGNPNARNFTPLNYGRNFTPTAPYGNRKPSIALPIGETLVEESNEIKLEPKPISDEDKKVLESLIGEAAAAKLIQLDGKIQTKTPISADERNVVFDTISDRAQRATVHQGIRRIFESRVETLANNTGVITAMPVKSTGGSRHAGQAQGPRRDGNRGHNKSFGQLGGEYLHFTIYKENKDTMDAVNTMARLLKVKATNFGFAGTKDRRAGTTQRISVYRQRAVNLIWLNSRLPNLKVGDFNHSKLPLQLGQHGGNEFIITLKNCHPLNQGSGPMSLEQQMKMIQSSLEAGLAYLRHRGYLNYFGLQRFGTYSIGTHMLGMKILKDDFESVIDDILHVEEQYVEDVLDNKVPQALGPVGDNNRDDFGRAKAITTWNLTKNAQKALELLPKRFSSEAAIIQHLGKNPKDFMGAILSITRGMRMMYIHAYQSYVWNFVATHRWSKYGNTAIVGDLVMVDNQKDRDLSDSIGDVASSDADDDGNFYAQAKALSAEDIASGKYTIFDVVLPTPGYDVIYPQNDIGEYYVTFMGKEENGGLDPFDMRRRKKEFSLSGSYRHLLGRFITEPEYAIRLYSDDTQQMYPTDLDFCLHNKALKKAQSGRQPFASPGPEAAASTARWADFSKNASRYDQLMEDNRRRRASDSPPSDGVITTRETWVQTGVDDSAKRVKLARYHDTIESVANETGGDVNVKPMVEKSPETMEPRVYIDTAMEDIITPIPDQKEKVGNLDTTTKSASQAYYERITATSDARLPSSPGLTTPLETAIVGLSSTASHNTPNAAVEDPHNWYGGLLPTLGAPSVAGSQPPGNETNTKEEDTSVTKIGKIVLPTFCKPSDNPILSVNDFSHELVNNPNAKKIAVVLKFQLKASNYATVVLRELMGSTAEDVARTI